VLASGPRVPGAPALVDRLGAEIDFPTLHAAVAERARRWAPDQAVCVASPTPVEYVIDALSVLAAGAVLCPLDVRWSAAEQEAIVHRIGAAAWVRVGVERYEGVPLERGASLVLSTSGSSGVPKDVLLGRAGLLANVDAILSYLPVAEFPRTGVVLPLNYSYALVGQVLATLRVGGTAILLSDLAWPAEQSEALLRLGAQGVSSVPASLRLLAEAGPPLCYVASAGAPLTDATVDAVRGAWPDARAFNQYGLTEASPRVTAVAWSDPGFARGSVGRAIPGVQVECVDGELVVRGPSVMLRYLNDPAGTQAVLGPGGLRTGDRGRVDAEGYVYVSGRADDLVKIAGERVSLEAVRQGVAALAGVREVAVAALPDARTDLRLGALVVLAGGTLAEVRRAARRLHPARRPTRWTVADALPHTVRGKLDRGAVRALLEA
jgi:long-chain acyl-CoA synthetase